MYLVVNVLLKNIEVLIICWLCFSYINNGVSESISTYKEHIRLFSIMTNVGNLQVHLGGSLRVTFDYFQNDKNDN